MSFSPRSFDCYLREVSRYRPIPREKEYALADRAKCGDKSALHELCNANLRFVVSVAKGYRKCNVPIGDLISAGNLGMIRAIERYDSSKGIKFISFAVWWIRLEILNLIGEVSRVVYIPASVRNDLYKIPRTIDKMEQSQKRYVSESEALESISYQSHTKDAQTAIAPVLHLDATPRNSSEPAVESVRGEDSLFNDELDVSSQLDAIAATLTERERDILIRCIGHNETLESVGGRHNLTKERIRQIKAKALKKCRISARMLRRCEII